MINQKGQRNDQVITVKCDEKGGIPARVAGAGGAISLEGENASPKR